MHLVALLLAVKIVGPSATKALTAAQIAALPRTRVTISDHGVKATFEGTELTNLLAMVGVPSGEKLRGKELTDPAFAERKIILADQRDGKPLSEKEGPFRVIVEGERRQARCVRQVTRIVVGRAP